MINLTNLFRINKVLMMNNTVDNSNTTETQPLIKTSNTTRTKDQSHISILTNDVKQKSQKFNKTKLISVMIVGGGLVLAGTTFAISAPLISWAKQYQKTIITQVPQTTLPEIFPDFTDKLPVDFPDKLPVPDGQTILDALDIDEINNIITNDPAFSEFSKRLPVIDNTLLPDLSIDPLTGLPTDPIIPPIDPMTTPIDPMTPPIDPMTPPIDPMTPPIEPPVPMEDVASLEGLDEKLKFLQDPKFIGGLGGGVAGLVLIAVLAFIFTRNAEKSSDKDIIKCGEILNKILNSGVVGDNIRQSETLEEKIQEKQSLIDRVNSTTEDDVNAKSFLPNYKTELRGLIEQKKALDLKITQGSPIPILRNLLGKSWVDGLKHSIDWKTPADQRLSKPKNVTLGGSTATVAVNGVATSTEDVKSTDKAKRGWKEDSIRYGETIVDRTKKLSERIDSLWKDNSGSVTDEQKQALNYLVDQMNVEHKNAFPEKRTFKNDKKGFILDGMKEFGKKITGQATAQQ